ncbi:MAG: hypothetical protein R3217_08850 [Gammaproteobacteria bacterium]|nr:hypothetical protein [Gammaproteobacteria bacterium]
MSGVFSMWLPILVSAVAVFFASSAFHMLLKFWHQADYNGFENEEGVRAAMRGAKPGIYTIPYCSDMSDMAKPEVQEKFKEGPMAVVFVAESGMPNMGKSLGSWVLYCLVVSVFVAYVGSLTLGGADGQAILRVTWTVAFMAYGLGVVPYAIWWGQPWKAIAKDLVDALVYGLLTGLCFMWLWPAAA